MIEGATIGQAMGDAQGICDPSLTSGGIGVAVMLLGLLLPTIMYHYMARRAFQAPIMALGARAAERRRTVSGTLSARENAKMKIRHGRYRSAFGDDTETDTETDTSTIEKLQNAYARDQISMERFELLVAGAICHEEGYDKSLLEQEFDDSDTEDDHN